MAQQHAMLAASAACLDLCPDQVEQKIIRAYVQLAVALDHAEGFRTVTLLQLGSLEVRLLELAQDMIGLPPFWLELRSPLSGAILDSFGCYDFDEHELAAAVAFVLEAAQSVRTLH